MNDFTISDIPDKNVPCSYRVVVNRSNNAYRVCYYGPVSSWNSCECSDFRTNTLGTCRHIRAVAKWLKAQGREPESIMPRNSCIDVCYIGSRRLRLRVGEENREAILMAAMRYFDDDMYVVEGMTTELPSFIEQARRLDPRFHVTGDALAMILDERDRSRRHQLVAAMSDSEIGESLSTRLYSFQIEGIRFAFGAGRALIADEMGLGKAVQALGTAELFKSRSMVTSVLILCPTSLKYQWKREIESITGSDVTVVEGAHDNRRELYRAPSFYKIVSYHTLSNDIKTVEPMHFDMLIMDEAQRLEGWNERIGRDVSRVNSDYTIVLSATPLAADHDLCNRLLRYVDRYTDGNMGRYVISRRRVDVGKQLPVICRQTRLVPMTREQQSIHDQSRATAMSLARKWKQHGFLSEKDRKRLLISLGQMRMVCDSTYVIDQHTRYGTKVGEAVALIREAIVNGLGKVVVFSQWERMTRILAEELDREGIGYEYLHGGVRFASDSDVHVFLATDAGSPSENLKVARVVVNIDLPWNPATLDKRMTRVRSDIQSKLLIYNLVSSDSIEEDMFDAGRSLFTDAGELPDGQITIDDDRLTAIADILLAIGTEKGTPAPSLTELLSQLTAEQRSRIEPILIDMTKILSQ